jgi:hypothetical protein
MGYEIGAVKWMFGMLLTPVGYVSLYIFGDGIWNTITHLRALLHLLQYAESPDVLVIGLVDIYVPTPEFIIESLFVYPAIGASVGALLWYQGSVPHKAG